MIIFSTNETPFNIIFFNYGIFFPPDYTGKMSSIYPKLIGKLIYFSRLPLAVISKLIRGPLVF